MSNEFDLGVVIDVSLFSELDKVIHLFPEIHQELTDIKLNLFTKLMDNGLRQFWQDLDNKTDEIDDLNIEISELKEQKDDLVSELDELNDRIHDLETTIEERDSIIEELENKLSDEREDFSNQISALEEEINNLRL